MRVHMVKCLVMVGLSLWAVNEYAAQPPTDGQPKPPTSAPSSAAATPPSPSQPAQPAPSGPTPSAPTPPAGQPTPSTGPTPPAISPAPSAPSPAAAPSAPTPGGMPQAPQPITTPSKPIPQAEVKEEGITTAHLQEPSGNWLAKRGWWEKAKDLYGKIRKKTDQVFDQRMIFFNKRTELGHTLFDPFYINAGLGRGELEELLNYLMAQMEEQRTKEGMLSEQDRVFMQTLNKEKQTLEQLKLDVEAIAKLDSSIDDALSRLMEQLNVARSYEQKAWEDFKTIADVLNDKKARELYYAMITYDENIAAISNYIQHDLGNYFDQLTKTATEHVNRIKGALQSLKEKGIDFKKKAKELEEQDTQAAKARKERERIEREEREKEEAEELEAQSWLGWFKRGFASVWNSVADIFGGIYSTVSGWFGGSEHTQEEHAPAKTPTTPPPTPRAVTPVSAPTSGAMLSTGSVTPGVPPVSTPEKSGLPLPAPAQK